MRSLRTNSVVVEGLYLHLNSGNDIDNPALDYLRLMCSNGFYNNIKFPTSNKNQLLLDHVW